MTTSSPEPKPDIDDRLSALRAEFAAESPPVPDEPLSAPTVGQEVRLIRVPRWVYLALAGILAISLILFFVFAAPRLGLIKTDSGLFQALATPLPSPPAPTALPTATRPVMVAPPVVELPPPPAPTFPPAPPSPTPLPTPDPNSDGD